MADAGKSVRFLTDKVEKFEEIDDLNDWVWEFNRNRKQGEEVVRITVTTLGKFYVHVKVYVE
jgi:hypothetical protein